MPHERRKKLEESLAAAWRVYEQAIVDDALPMQSAARHDIGFLLASLLNTYLDHDPLVEWQGTWSDRLLDPTIESSVDGERTASGLMAISNREACKMRLAPFAAAFTWPSESASSARYHLRLALAGPQEDEWSIPYTDNHAARQELMNRHRRNSQGFATLYQGSFGMG